MASPAGGEPMSARKIQDLRVIDLKAQLESRGIERTGVKASLIDRLKKALEEEGHDAENYVFEIDMKKGVKADAKDKEKDDDELEEADEMAGLENGDADKTLTEEPPADSTDTKPASADLPALDPPETLNLGDELVLNVGDDIKMDKSDAKMDDVSESVPVLDAEESNTLDEGAGDEKKQDETTKEMEAPSSTVSEKTAPTENKLSGDLVSEPPSPSSVPVIAPFTKEDLIYMDTSAEHQVDEDLSLIVHIDESQMDLDNDLLNTPAKQTGEGSKAGEEAGSTTPKAENQETGSNGADETTPTKASNGETAEAGQGSVAPDAAATTDEQKTTLSKDDKAKSTAAKPDATGAKAKAVPASSRNLWISGLASSTRATDLKTLFSKYGKVAGAKVVTNAKSPGSRCYGFVTMTTADEASKCIQHLHRTELHGKMISVERAKNDPSAQAKIIPKPAPQKKDEGNRDRDRRDNDRDRRTSGGSRRLSGRLGDRLGDRDRDRSRNRDRRSSGSLRTHSRRSPGHRSPAAGRDAKDRDDKDKEPAKDDKDVKDADKDTKDKDAKERKEKEVLDFEKIKAERERERLKQKERQMREEERRRMRELERMRERQNDVERRQREESVRLEREKQRLRLEQQRLERERLEAERERIALERERQRRERERLEKEREQERLQQMRLEQERRAMKRNYDSRGGGRDEYWNDPKRPNIDRNQRYDDKSSGEPFERRVERYDRRDGRPLDTAARPAGDRFEGRRDDRHEGRRPAAAPSRENRDRDDRSRPTEERNRPDRYPERRDGPPPARDHDRPRHDRDRSPHGAGHHSAPGHHAAPARTSPAHRQPDTRTEWKGERNAVPAREGRGRGVTATRPPATAERSYTDNRAPATRETGAWHGARAGNPPAQADRKPHGYNTGPGLLGTKGNAPGSMDHTWNTADRSNAAPVAAMSSRPTERTWTTAQGQTAERVSVRPQPTVMAVQQPLLQTPPTSAAFLASAANIMMGVGLAGNRNTTQDNRYDAYKNLQGGNVRRY